MTLIFHLYGFKQPVPSIVSSPSRCENPDHVRKRLPCEHHAFSNVSLHRFTGRAGIHVPQKCAWKHKVDGARCGGGGGDQTG